MNENRLKHIYGVAKKMVEIAKSLNLSKEVQEELYMLGFLHDAAYGLTQEGKNHDIIGGEILKRCGYKYWKEIYYHGKLQTEYDSTYLRILNMADMQVNSRGEDVGYVERLEDIKERFGKESTVYKNCIEFINYVKERGKEL